MAAGRHNRPVNVLDISADPADHLVFSCHGLVAILLCLVPKISHRRCRADSCNTRFYRQQFYAWYGFSEIIVERLPLGIMSMQPGNESNLMTYPYNLSSTATAWF